MSPPTKIPKALVLGLVLAIVLDTAVQIVWKWAVLKAPPDASVSATLLAAVSNRFFYWAMLGFAAQLANWLWVLTHADLSFAQPFTALGYITVLGLSRPILREPISGSKIVGVALILIGVFFISRTPHRTPQGSLGK